MKSEDEGQEPSHSLREAARATWELQWSELAAHGALRCLAGLAIPLALGIVLDRPMLGAVAASGALAAGFGSFERVRGSYIIPMLLASGGIGLSAFVGTLVCHNTLGFIMVAGLWAFGCGLLAALGSSAWWIGLQCVIYALIASNYPQGLGSALSCAALVTGGGLLQTLLVAVFLRVQPQSSGLETSAQDKQVGLREAIRSALGTLKRSLTPRTEVGREALRLGFTVAVAAGASRLLTLPNGYWMPMTALLVLKVDLHQTLTRGLGRVVGTLVGAGVCTLLASWLRPGPVALTVLVLGFAWLCYSLLRVNYAIYAVCITSFVVFQLALVGLPEITVVPARLLYTVLGGTLALLAHLLWPTPGRDGPTGAAFDVGC